MMGNGSERCVVWLYQIPKWSFPTFGGSFRRTRLRHAIAQHPQVQTTLLYPKYPRTYLSEPVIVCFYSVVIADIQMVRELEHIY